MQNIRDNGAKASINFQRCDMKVAPFHNAREAFLPETSHPELVEKNECSCSALAALKKIKKWDQQADEAYLKTYGQKSALKEKNKVWECVINLRENHTLKDVKKLTKKLEKITGYKAAQIAIHKDEGHYEEGTGDFIQNVHAHVIFYARDTETGLSLSAENYRRKDLMRIMQDTVASELGMERGQSAEITGAKHMSPRAFKAQKRQEATLEKTNAEWEQKLETNNAEWQAKMAEKQKEWEAKKAAWEQKQAEREAKREEWERRIPEIMAARERRSKFISDKLDWEDARTGKMLARDMELLGLNFAGIANPHGNPLLEAQKDAIRNVFKMLGVTAQLAVFLLNKTLQNDEKIKSDAKIYNVESTLLRAVDYVANSDPANGEELKKLIQRKLMLIPEEKRRELFEYAIENAPTDELREDIKALVEGRFDDIARTAAAQKRIENRDLRQSLREYSEEIRKIRDELKQMDEENRILVAAERALLREKGANREEYADQEASNRKRLEEIKGLKDEVKRINNELNEARKQQEIDKNTLKEQADKIKELNAQIAEITEENAKKQKELEEELKQEKAKRLITPQQLDKAERRISELEDKIKEQEFVFYGKADEIEAAEFEKDLEKQIVAPQTLDIFDVIDEQKPEKIEPEKQREEPKIEKPEPIREPEPKPAKDDNLNIYGYQTYTPEPRRRLDDYEPVRKIEPEPEPEPIFRDPWEEISDAMKKWQKTDSEVEKNIIKNSILKNIEKYEKSGIPPHRQLAIDSYRSDLNYDPAAADAEAIRQMRERELELERKRQAAELELEKKYDDVKKNVKQETDARQRDIKKKKKDELEMGMS
nr:hypothetical protein [uncultured Campylobacter sp.]